MASYGWGSIGYPKRKIYLDMYVATPLIYYLATPNNFIGLKRDDINKILIIYLL